MPLDDAEKQKLESDVHRLVVNRDPKFTNVVEVRPRYVGVSIGCLRSCLTEGVDAEPSTPCSMV